MPIRQLTVRRLIGQFRAAAIAALPLLNVVGGGCRSPAAPRQSSLASRSEAEWVELFDGTSLSGWRASENSGTWSVAEGALVARGPRSHLFYTGGAGEAPFRDFELEADLLTEPHANSGIFIHTAYQETGWPAKGVEIQVNNTFPPDPRRTGSIYSVRDLQKSAARDSEWWKLRIRVQNAQVMVFVNDELVNEYTERAETEPKRLGSGTIALQAHDPGSVVHYRRVRIRRLASGENPDGKSTADRRVPEDLFLALNQWQYDQDRAPVVAVETLVDQAEPSQLLAIELQLAGIVEDRTATAGARDACCRILRRIGTGASIPALTRMLADPDCSHAARYALAREGDAVATAALRSGLSACESDELIGVILSLGRLRDAAATPQLATLLTAGDRHVAAAATTAHGQIGTPETLTVLRATAERPAETPPTVVHDAMLRAAEHVAQEGHRALAISVYHELFGPERPTRIRVAAMRGLVMLKPGSAATLLTDVLSNDGPELQAAAVQLVRDLEGTDVTRAFASRVEELAPNQQAALLKALTLRGDRAALPAMTEALKSSDSGVCLAALAGLARIGGSDQILPLARFGTAGSGSQRSKAVQAIAGLDADGVDSVVVEHLRDPDPMVRQIMIEVISAREIATASQGLLELAESDADGRVRLAAIRSLPSVLGLPDLAKVIRLLVHSGDERESAEIQKALAALAEGKPDDPAGHTAIATACAAATDARVKGALLRVLGHLGRFQTLWLVEASLTDPSEVISHAAVRALCDWPDERALRMLLDQAERNPDRVGRLLSLRAAVRLLTMRGSRPPVDSLGDWHTVMRAAPRPEDQRLVLSGLATTALPEAIPLVRPFLAQSATCNEAAMALTVLAKGIVGLNRQQAEATAREALSASASPAVQRAANEALELIDAMGDYLMVWQAAGPFAKPGAARDELLHTVFAPEQMETAAAVQWQPLPTGQHPEKPWLLDLNRVFSGENRVAYLSTFVYTARERQAKLELGSDDNVKVWLNGRRIHANQARRGVEPAADVVPVTLYQGWNRLLLKIVQGTGDWGACARLVNGDGTRIEDMVVQSLLNREQLAHVATRPPPKRILAWSMEKAGNELQDDSGYGVRGELRGDPLEGKGVTGQCLVFDGVDDEVRAEAVHLPAEPGAGWSMNAFVYLDKPMDELTIVAGFGDVVSAQPIGCQRYLVRLRDSIHFWGANVDVRAGMPFVVGKWQMITLTYDGDTISIYHNGKRLVSQAEALALAAPTVHLAPPDHWGKGTRFAGRLDEFTVWGDALTPAEIATLFAPLRTLED